MENRSKEICCMQQREKYEREVKTNIVTLLQSDVKERKEEMSRFSLDKEK